MRCALFLIAATLSAQQFTIDAGSTSDRNYSGGTAYTNAQLATMQGVYRTMRQGAAFSYDIPVSNGTCSVTLDLIEPRAAGPNPATDSSFGTRLFTVTSGALSKGVDIFAAIGGARTPYPLELPSITVADQHLRLQFKALKGNAVLSGIEVNCTPPPTTPTPPFSLDLDGVWRLDASLRITGSFETGAGSILPSKETLRLPDGSTADGVSGLYRLGTCQVKLQAGTVVGVAC